MSCAREESLPRPVNRQTKLIKSLRLKKYREQENAFLVEGAKNVTQLLTSSFKVRMLVGTPAFLAAHRTLWQDGPYKIFQTDERSLAAMGSLTSNKTALAVASIPTTHQQPPPVNSWGLVLDNINDPGNLGTIIRIADWYDIPTIVCSPTTVDLYNPKVLQASMGSFLRLSVHYTPLSTFLSHTLHPIWGTFTQGDNLHDTSPPSPGWVIVGNESQGISFELLPYVQQHITIPRYGKAESLNAAVATAIVCDRWRESKSGTRQAFKN